jgi:hypothetical protein
VLLALAACSGHGGSPDAAPDPQGPGTCDAVWMQNGFSQCDLGCANSSIALAASGPQCQARTSVGNPVDCSKTFVIFGVTGCCASDPPRLLFATCTP